MPPRGQCLKSSFQPGDLLQANAEFFGHTICCRFLVGDLQTCFFHFNGLQDILFQERFPCCYFPGMGESYLACCLYVLSLLDKQAMGVLHQSAFEKQKRAVRFKGMYQDDIAPLKCVARASPFQFFGQRTVEEDLSQGLGCFLPRIGLAQIGVHFRIHVLNIWICRSEKILSPRISVAPGAGFSVPAFPWQRLCREKGWPGAPWLGAWVLSASRSRRHVPSRGLSSCPWRTSEPRFFGLLDFCRLRAYLMLGEGAYRPSVDQKKVQASDTGKLSVATAWGTTHYLVVFYLFTRLLF